MKTKHTFIKRTGIITVIIFMCAFTKNYAENSAKTVDFFIGQTVTYPGNYNLTTGSENIFFEINAHIKTKKPLPNSTFLLNGFSVRFSPVLYKEKKKTVPVLSVFFGGLNKAAFIRQFSEPIFSNQKPSAGGIKFFPKNFINCSNSKKDISRALEVCLKNFNLMVLTEQENFAEKADIHLCAAYKAEDLTDGSTSVGAAFYTSIFPNHYAKFVPESKNYNMLYSGEVIFLTETDHGEFSVLGLGTLNLPHKAHKPALAGRAEFDFFKDYAGFDSGISLRQKEFSGVKGKTQEETLSLFFRPKFISRIFKITAIYNFLKQYNKQNELSYVHSSGFDLKIGNSNYAFKTKLFYETEWDWDTQFEIKKAAFWQEAFLLGCKFNFENKKENPFVVRNYSVNTAFKINCGKIVQLGCAGKIGRKNIRVLKTVGKGKEKTKNTSIEWQKIKAEGSLYIEVSKKLKRFEHSAKAEITFLTEKPFYSFSLEYKIKGHL